MGIWEHLGSRRNEMTMKLCASKSDAMGNLSIPDAAVPTRRRQPVSRAGKWEPLTRGERRSPSPCLPPDRIYAHYR